MLEYVFVHFVKLKLMPENVKFIAIFHRCLGPQVVLLYVLVFDLLNNYNWYNLVLLMYIVIYLKSNYFSCSKNYHSWKSLHRPISLQWRNSLHINISAFPKGRQWASAYIQSHCIAEVHAIGASGRLEWSRQFWFREAIEWSQVN